MAEDLYSELGVPRGSDSETIKKAYRKLAKTLHPDRNPGNDKAEARFKKVNHAFDVLGDPKKRKLYDEFGEEGLREGFDPDRVRQYKDWAAHNRGGVSGQGGRQGGFDGSAVNLEDLFANAGGAGGAAGQGGIGDMFGDLFGRARRTRGPMKGSDFESEITIDFPSSVRGATLEIRPHGMTGDPVTVRIPAGAAEGSRVRIAGQGGPSPNGGPNGDLLLLIHVHPHPYFRREGDDLHVDVPVTVAEAYRGAKVKVPTVDAAVSLKVPERSQSGSIVRVRGKGVARKGKDAGDLYVHFLVHVPTESTPEVERAIDALAAHSGDELRRALKF